MDPDEQIIEFLNGADWVTAEEIATGIGHDPEKTSVRLERLAERGLVDYYRSGYPLKWGLTNDSMELGI